MRKIIKICVEDCDDYSNNFEKYYGFNQTGLNHAIIDLIEKYKFWYESDEPTWYWHFCRHDSTPTLNVVEKYSPSFYDDNNDSHYSYITIIEVQDDNNILSIE